jgi:tyrosyl-tRNA synthetase
MNLVEELQWRGFVGQFSADSLAVIINNEKRTVYHGIDPTADSAHVGNFVVWLLLKHLVNDGHKVVFLVGGGTGMIGDPKPDKERTLSSKEDVEKRVNKIKKQAETILGAESITFIDNYEWLSSLGLLEFLRDIGKHFTVNELIKKDAIAKRLATETGLSYTEFAYPLLQAYDYLTLYRKFGCTLQVGGSDQWGNMVAGIDLVRRVEKAEVHVMTVPLIVDKSTGKKFGKSEGNAVWLDSEKTSPFVFYQFWLNVSDTDVIDYLKLFTFLNQEQILSAQAESQINPGQRIAQKLLAGEMTKLVHGELLFRNVEKATACLFGEVLIEELTPIEKDILLASAPTTTIESGSLLVDVLVESELASSKREARTFLESGAVAVNGTKIIDQNYVLDKNQNGELIHLKRGKKNVSLLTFK